MISTDPSIWLTAILMLGIYSYLYKENIYSRLIEYTFVSAAVGWGFVLIIKSIINTGVTPLLNGNYFLVIPFLLAVCLFSRYSKEYGWLSDYPIKLMLGVGLGIVVQGTVSASIIKQISASMVTLNINNIIFLIMLLSSMVYFIFTVEYEGAVGETLQKISEFGHYVFMVAFGAGFANYILTRTSVLISRFQFLLWDWLGLFPS